MMPVVEHSAAVYLTTSPKLKAIPNLQTLLQARVALTWPWSRAPAARCVLAWGRKPSALKAEALAKRLNLAVLRLEDGFLRSFDTGATHPPLALVVDELGIYYDSTRPSSLEALLASDVDVLAELGGGVSRAREFLVAHGLSKYNHADDGAGLDGFASPAMAGSRGQRITQRVLVIDQTAGDMSVALGGASAHTFADMLAAARTENPNATIYVKTHPEVTTGRKGGYLTHVSDGVSPRGQRTVMLRGLMNPLRLVEQMDRVYVVSSTMGFEALLVGKPVTCFGVPWYAGWGVTDDRCTRSPAWARRTRTRSVDELFAAAYFHYTRYLNPVTHERGSIFDVMQWLARQREMLGLSEQGALGCKGVFDERGDGLPQGATRPAPSPLAKGRLVVVGFARWRRYNLAPIFSLLPDRVHFVPDADRAAALKPGPTDTLVCWGRSAPPGVEALAASTGARLARMEDGFVRGVGLGSDLLRPMSLVLDGRGIYFDPTIPCDLEHLLNTQPFTEKDARRAAAVRRFIVQHGITKYNLEPREAARWPVRAGQRVVLVPGQVEDDASIRFGCTHVRSNLALLKAARAACADAFIVYKPHPDVMSGNRAGRVAFADTGALADRVETGLSVVSCLEACDEVHTMTSLTGFDALLRDKRVVTYGQPFYAGWGLTVDRAGEGGGATQAFERRARRLTLDELVAGTLLHYPLYWDWSLKGFTTCEAVLNILLAERTALEAEQGLEGLRTGWLQRQWRKLQVLRRAWMHPL